MKILGIDDGYFPPYFKSRKGYTLLVGVLYSDNRILTIIYDKILIDGDSVTESIISFLKQCKETDVLILDGVTYAGFDIADAFSIWREIGTPLIIVQQYRLDLGKIKKALEKNFVDHERRYRIVEEIVKLMKPYRTRWKTIMVASIGLDENKVTKLLEKTMIYSPVPEPLRLAHQIASIISKRITYRLVREGARI